MSATFKIEAELPFTTEMPRDVAVNRFWCSTINPIEDRDTLADDMEARFLSFYNDVADGADNPIAYHLSTIINRATDVCALKFYDLAAPAGSPPFRTTAFTLGAANATGFNLPEQLALCISYWGSGESVAIDDLSVANVIPLRNRRGRVYIGPLRSETGSSGSGSFFRPTDTALNDLMCAAKAVSDANTGFNVGAGGGGGWVVASGVAQQGHPGYGTVIDNGWVDNRYDTQRRRDVDATARVTWHST